MYDIADGPYRTMDEKSAVEFWRLPHIEEDNIKARKKSLEEEEANWF